MATSASDTCIRFTQTGGKPGDAYGNSPDSDNSVVLKYRDLDGGTAWGSGDTLSGIVFYLSAGLTYASGSGMGTGVLTVKYYVTITCNGATVRYPASGYASCSSGGYNGYGNPYNGFTWDAWDWHDTRGKVCIGTGTVACVAGGRTTNYTVNSTVTSGTLANFLTGIKNYNNITTKYYFENSSYRIISNATGEILAWKTGNAPSTPTFNYPVASKTTYNTKPRFSMKGTDADGDKLTYQYSLNNSTWTNLATGVSSGTSKAGQVSTAQSTGSKTLYIRTYDGANYSSVASRAFTIGSTSLGVSAGKTIDDTTIDNAQSYITNLASYYGNSAPSWTTCNAGTKLNLAQITELNTRLKALTPAQSFTVPSAGSAIAASTFNTTINNAIKNS